jgi:hypothetical protein
VQKLSQRLGDDLAPVLAAGTSHRRISSARKKEMGS